MNGIFTRGIGGRQVPRPATWNPSRAWRTWKPRAWPFVPGAALFVRTRPRGRSSTVRTGAEPGHAGLDPSVIRGYSKRDVAVLGGAHPRCVSPHWATCSRLAVHDFVLIMMGVHLFDNLDLDAVAERAAAEGRWEFLLTAALAVWPEGPGRRSTLRNVLIPRRSEPPRCFPNDRCGYG